MGAFEWDGLEMGSAPRRETEALKVAIASGETTLPGGGTSAGFLEVFGERGPAFSDRERAQAIRDVNSIQRGFLRLT